MGANKREVDKQERTSLLYFRQKEKKTFQSINENSANISCLSNEKLYKHHSELWEGLKIEKRLPLALENIFQFIRGLGF